MKTYNIKSLRLSRVIKTFVGGLLVAFTASCSDFLTIYPTDAVVLENYWKEKADVEALVSNCYRSMSQLNFLEKFIVWGEIRSDNVIGGPTYNDAGNSGLRDINEANLFSTNGYTSWADYYNVINNCNIVLKFAPEVKELDPDYTEGDYKVHKGEMLAIRALCHFCLLRTFRDIPLLTEAMIDDSQELYQAQVSPMEALDCILADLYEAEYLVRKSGNYIKDAENCGRMTRDAVRAMIADALLWKAAFTQYTAPSDSLISDPYYTQCAEYCDLIINERMSYLEENKSKFSDLNLETMKYPLVENFSTGNLTYVGSPAYDEVFGSGMNSMIESIFEIQVSGADVEEQNYVVPKIYGRENGTSAPFVASSYLYGTNESDLYPETDIRRVSFMNVIDAAETDCPITKYGAMTHGGIFSKSNKILIPSYRINKYQGDDKKAYEKMYYIEGCNWIVYRISDVMLMKAEALAHRADSAANDLASAFDLVSAVYYRSNKRKDISNSDTLTYVHGSAESVQDLVLAERQRELCFEGKRWHDLVRKALRDGSVKDVVDRVVEKKYDSSPNSYKNKMPDIDYLFFPIQERELNANPLLKQNPAYETESMYDKN